MYTHTRAAFCTRVYDSTTTIIIIRGNVIYPSRAPSYNIEYAICNVPHTETIHVWRRQCNVRRRKNSFFFFIIIILYIQFIRFYFSGRDFIAYRRQRRDTDIRVQWNTLQVRANFNGFRSDRIVQWNIFFFFLPADTFPTNNTEQRFGR